MWQSLGVSLRLAFVSASCTIFVALFFAWLNIRSKNFFSHSIAVMVGLPQVLPPTVLGFFLLFLVSPVHGPGAFLNERFGIQFVFSFPLICVGVCILCLPAAFNSLRRSLLDIPKSVSEASCVLGYGSFRYVFTVLLPLIRSAIISCFAVAFGQSLGSFGVVYMLGGNISGRTRTLSIYVFEQIQMLNWGEAALSAVVQIVFSIAVLSLVKILEVRSENPVV